PGAGPLSRIRFPGPGAVSGAVACTRSVAIVGRAASIEGGRSSPGGPGDVARRRARAPANARDDDLARRGSVRIPGWTRAGRGEATTGERGRARRGAGWPGLRRLGSARGRTAPGARPAR